MEIVDYKLNSHTFWNLSVRALENPNSTLSPSTTTPGSGDWNSLTYMSIFGVVLTFGFVLVAVVAVMAVKFCETYKNASGFRSACKVFAKCGWVREVCRCEGGDEEDVESETRGSASEREASEHWDPPRYRDALRMQRLDSTTILGIPPPLYDSVEIKEDTEFEDYTNSGFEYTADLSRQVSWEHGSMSIRRGDFPSDDILSRIDLPDYDISNDLAPVHLSSVDREDTREHITLHRCDQNCQSDNDNSGNTDNHTTRSAIRCLFGGIELEPLEISVDTADQQYDNSPIEGRTHAGGVRTISEHVDSKTLSRTKPMSSVWDRLPTYEDVLLWIKGTQL